MTSGITQGSRLLGCKALRAMSHEHVSFGMEMLLLHVVGQAVSGSSCAAANNENNKMVQEMFS